MSYAERILRGALRRLLLAQALLILAVVAGYWLVRGDLTPLAALFGGGVALFNTLISAYHLRRATQAASSSMKRGMMEIYFGAITRFVATPALIAGGIALLDLDPIAMIAGFAVAQLGYLFNRAQTS